MNTTSDVWFAFVKTFSMLFLVLALIVMVFYLVRKLSAAKGSGSGKDFIKILCVHHLSPKEKLVLLNVLGDTILIGVTSAQISKIATVDSDIDFSSQEVETPSSFKTFLTSKLSGSSTGGHKPLFKEQSQEDGRI